MSTEHLNLALLSINMALVLGIAIQAYLQLKALRAQHRALDVSTYNQMLWNYSHLQELQIVHIGEVGEGWGQDAADQHEFSNLPKEERNQYRLLRIAFDLFERAHRLHSREKKDPWIKREEWERRWKPLIQVWCRHRMFEKLWRDCKTCRFYSVAFLDYVDDLRARTTAAPPRRVSVDSLVASAPS